MKVKGGFVRNLGSQRPGDPGGAPEAHRKGRRRPGSSGGAQEAPGDSQRSLPGKLTKMSISRKEFSFKTVIENQAWIYQKFKSHSASGRSRRGQEAQETSWRRAGSSGGVQDVQEAPRSFPEIHKEAFQAS